VGDVELVQDGPILEIRLNRPTKKNAVTNAMYLSVVEGLRTLEADDVLRVGVLSGEGQDFCAGNDVGDFLEPTGLSGATALLEALPRASKPLVAAVQGKAIGIGATVLLHCDLVYVGTDLDLRFMFVDLGVVPEAGSTMLLPARVGRVRAAEAMLLTRPVDAQRAVAWGIANQAVEPGEVRVTALAAARTLAAKPPNALRATRAFLRGEPDALVERIHAEIGVFSEMLSGPEFGAAAARFLKR
jgi:enoyl-CoA hydratase/carnithine racemase